jgi:Fur family ferric uptake transcriptional regulator
LLERAYDLLKKHDLRITPQRKAILQILFNYRGHHLETENIHQLIVFSENNKRKAGLATVYRAMEMLERVGLVSRLTIEGSPARYELILPEELNHHHLICLRCGNVQEVDDSLIESLRRNIMNEKNFLMVEKTIKIYGYCSNCRNNK